MTGSGEARGGHPLATKILALAAAVSAAHYYVLHEILGLLAVDEIYFAHVFWLLRSGSTLYIDFFENHWPTYVYLLAPLLPSGSPTDLTFVWWLRGLSLIGALLYAAMLWTTARRDFLYLLPFLFLFLTFGRMTEIRPDMLGLLLFNAGWWLLLLDTSRRNMLIAALLAAAALSFSARAAIMAVGMGALLAFFCAKRRDWLTLKILVGFGVAFVVCALAAYLLAPGQVWGMVSLIYFEPSDITPTIDLAARLIPVDRLLMVLVILAALVAAARRRTEARAQVILFACAAQMVLILVDPSPYQYVYGWAAIPALAGLAMLGDREPQRNQSLLSGISAGVALVVVSLSLSGPTPPTGSMLRLTYDRSFAGELKQMPTAELLRLNATTERQQGLWNQLALFSEICRRVPGPVVTKFYANMICQKDSLHDWPGLKWPELFEGYPSQAPRADFERLFAERPPALLAWGKQHYNPPLNPWGRALLADYDIYEGYALKRQR
jgi:hypothetical protein